MLSVKVKDVDTSLLDTGGRTLRIKSKTGKSFLTPTAPFTRKEAQAKSFLAFIGVIDGFLSGVQIDIKGERFLKFLRKNGTVKKVRREITQFSDTTCCYDNFLILDTPAINPDNLVQLKLLMEVQLRVMTLDYLAIPPLETDDIDKFRKVIVEWKKNAEEYGKGVVPQLYMNEKIDDFKEKLSILCELSKSGIVDIINLNYASPENYIHQYIEVWKRREEDVIFNCFNVPAKGKVVYPGIMESPNVEVQRYGIDTITPIKRTPSGKYIFKISHEKPPISTDELKFGWPYHPATSVLESNYWRKLPSHNVTCKCGVCNKESQSELIKKYSYDSWGEISKFSMNYASVLHNSQSSELEFQKIREYIKGNEMNTYRDEAIDYRKSYLYI